MLKLTTLNKDNNKKTKTIIFLLLSSYDTFWNLSVNYFEILLLLVITRRYALRRQRSNLKTALLHRCGLRKFNW